MKKNYVKPEIVVVKAEMESLLNTFSLEDGNTVGKNPGDGEVSSGDADSKGNNGGVWESEW